MYEQYESLDQPYGPLQRVSCGHDEANPDSSVSTEPLQRLVSPDSFTEFESEADTVGQWQQTAQTMDTRTQEAVGESAGRYQSLRIRSGQPSTPLSRPNAFRQRPGPTLEHSPRVNGYGNIKQALPSPQPDRRRAKLTPSRQQQLSRSKDFDDVNRVEHDLQGPSVVPTPPVETAEQRLVSSPASFRHTTAAPSRLGIIDVSPGQDGSLPSPRLSPITAAASLQQPGYFGDIDSNAELAPQTGQDTWCSDISNGKTSLRSREPTLEH